MLGVDRFSETQHPKPCRYHNVLGFTQFLVIPGFSAPLNTLYCVRFLVDLHSTQPTRRFNFYFQTHVTTVDNPLSSNSDYLLRDEDFTTSPEEFITPMVVPS